LYASVSQNAAMSHSRRNSYNTKTRESNLTEEMRTAEIASASCVSL
jgi:hypothetical protein